MKATGGNGRIPGLIDHDAGGFEVFESGAILMYLADKYGKFMPNDAQRRSQVQQWIMFQMAGVGPMMGQWNHFRGAKDADGNPVPYGVTRYQNETERLFGVLDSWLGRPGNTYLVGDELSIADFCMYPWCKLGSKMFGNDKPNFQRWLELLDARPAFSKGMTIGREPMSKM